MCGNSFQQQWETNALTTKHENISKEKWQTYCLSEKRCVYLLLIPKTACFVLVSFFKMHQSRRELVRNFLRNVYQKQRFCIPPPPSLTLCKVLDGVLVTRLTELLLELDWIQLVAGKLSLRTKSSRLAQHPIADKDNWGSNRESHENTATADTIFPKPRNTEFHRQHSASHLPLSVSLTVAFCKVSKMT